MFKKMQGVARVVGFMMTGALALLGAINMLGADTALAAFRLRAFQAPQAIEPMIVNYQGMLYDDLGTPLSGEYTLTFRLYDDPVALLGDALWSETLAAVTVREGHFSVLLGETSPITHGLFAQPDTYIGIQVESYDELLPRQRFATAPYAFYASRASGLTAPDGDPDDAVTVDDEGNLQASGDVEVTGNISGGSLDAGSGTITGGSISGSSLDVGSGDISGGDISGDSIDLANGYMYIDNNEVNSDGVLYLNYTSDADVRVGGDFDWVGHLQGLEVDDYTASVGGGFPTTVQMTSASNSVCFLTRDYFSEVGGVGSAGDCKISEDSGYWQLSAGGANIVLELCEAMCLSW